MDGLMHLCYPIGSCMYGCECCKFYGCDNCTNVPKSYHAYWERVEYEREWVLNRSTYRRENGRNERSERWEKRTIRSQQLADKKSKDYPIQSRIHFWRVLCCEYSDQATAYTLCPELGKPGSAIVCCCSCGSSEDAGTANLASG